MFDGYCVTKQKQQDDTTIFVVELDDGSDYRFYGPDKQALQVETHNSIHNVRFKEEPDKGVFTWEDGGEQNKLSVKLDSQNPPKVSHDSTGKTIGVAIAGVAIGALVGSLLSDEKKKPTQPPSSAPSSTAQTGQPDPALTFARDKCADALVQKTGQRVGTTDETLTLYPVSNAQNGLRGPATLEDDSSIQFDCVVNIRSGEVEKLSYK